MDDATEARRKVWKAITTDNPAYTTLGLSRRSKPDRLEHEWDTIPGGGTCLRCGVAGPDDEECPRRLRDAFDGQADALDVAADMIESGEHEEDGNG